jgi:hypothetical protein
VCAAASVPAADGPTPVVAVDLNADGKLDLASATRSRTTFRSCSETTQVASARPQDHRASATLRSRSQPPISTATGNPISPSPTTGQTPSRCCRTPPNQLQRPDTERGSRFRICGGNLSRVRCPPPMPVSRGHVHQLGEHRDAPRRHGSLRVAAAYKLVPLVATCHLGKSVREC